MKQIKSDPRARLKPCLRCCRSLLKNLDDRFCPDCGLSVWLSLNPNDAIEWSRPSWLRAVARGAWVLALMQPIALAAYVLATATSFWRDLRAGMIDANGFDPAHPEDGSFGVGGDEFLAAAPASGPASAPTADQIAAMQTAVAQRMHEIASEPSHLLAVAALLAGVYLIGNGIGLMLLTADERRYPDRHATTRTFAKVAASVGGAWGLLLCGVGAIGLPYGLRGGPVSSGITLLSEVLFLLSAVVIWLWLRPIATRGRHSALSRLCGYLLFLPVVPFLKARRSSAFGSSRC
ncbi:MAG: hypothetical protein QM770_04725 [Tepidisphaeraceae bacterium]